MADNVTTRRATANDAGIIAYHRACMFRDMGRVDDAQFDKLVRASTPYFDRTLAAGEYVSWLACDAQHAETILGGAGALLRMVAPYPVGVGTPGAAIAAGRQAIIQNVYVEPVARRRGIARLLMVETLAWLDAERIDSVVLHASDEGRALYASLGFVPTNEMRIPVRAFDQPEESS